MTGDGGMQDIPFALENSNATLNSFSWILMMTAVMVLTLLALNLFLAVCCSVFDDVHEEVSTHAVLTTILTTILTASNLTTSNPHHNAIPGDISDRWLAFTDQRQEQTDHCEGRRLRHGFCGDEGRGRRACFDEHNLSGSAADNELEQPGQRQR